MSKDEKRDEGRVQMKRVKLLERRVVKMRGSGKLRGEERNKD